MAQKEKKLKRYPVFMCALIIAGSICAGLVIRDRVKVADSQLTNADIVIDNDGSEYTVTINNDMDFSSGDMQMLVSDIIGERVERDNITLVKKQK